MFVSELTFFFFAIFSWNDVGGGSWYAREYPVAWTSIDGENFVDSDNEADRDDNDAGDDNQPGKLFSREDMDVMKAKAMVVIANRYGQNQQQKVNIFQCIS